MSPEIVLESLQQEGELQTRTGLEVLDHISRLYDKTQDLAWNALHQGRSLTKQEELLREAAMLIIAAPDVLGYEGVDSSDIPEPYRRLIKSDADRAQKLLDLNYPPVLRTLMGRDRFIYQNPPNYLTQYASAIREKASR